jgi:outer membrane protein assembly factor BamB
VKRLRAARAAALLVSLVLPAASGCAGGSRRADFGWFDGQKRAAGPGMLVSWTRDMISPGIGNYVPVEQASPGVDAVNQRLYVGTTRGVLWALTPRGRKLQHYNAESSIEAQPVIDSERGELYVSTVSGTVLALRSADLSLRFKAEVGASVSQPALLSRDAIYIVTDADMVLALSRTDGSVLWRYRREPREGFSIAGHAGLTKVGNRLLTGFGDGTAVALDAGDGRVLWEVDTSADLEDADDARHFVDVDTTPAVVGDIVYVASFSAGLFGLELGTGTVRAHESDLKGVTAITATPDALLVSSAERGVVCLDLPDLSLRWRRSVDRGAPGRAEAHGDGVYVAESLGALLTLALSDGREIGRLETGHGITAPATIGNDRRGFVLSNAGTLYAFSY